MTRAALLYTAYQASATEHDPDGPLSYAMFLRVVDRAAPIEQRVTITTPRGRPQLAYQGVVLVAAAVDLSTAYGGSAGSGLTLGVPELGAPNATSSDVPHRNDQ